MATHTVSGNDEIYRLLKREGELEQQLADAKKKHDAQDTYWAEATVRWKQEVERLLSELEQESEELQSDKKFLLSKIDELKAEVERLDSALEKAQKAVRLLDSMVKCKEGHSARSKHFVKQALKGVE